MLSFAVSFIAVKAIEWLTLLYFSIQPLSDIRRVPFGAIMKERRSGCSTSFVGQGGSARPCELSFLTSETQALFFWKEGVPRPLGGPCSTMMGRVL